MAAARLHLICYDIRDPSRLAHVGRRVGAYASGGQKSVRECWLTPRERRELIHGLQQDMDLRRDRLLVVRLDPRGRPRTLGRGIVDANDDLLVIA